jgi:exopolysaccharide biosynthesis WecB/TagA/CpsF family protein
MEAIPYASPEGEMIALDERALVLESLERGLAPARPVLLPAPRRGSLNVLRTRVDALNGHDVLDYLDSDAQSGVTRHLCYVNAHSLNLAHRDPAYQGVLSRADLVLNDGIGLQLAARMQGRRFEENLNGSDFTLRILDLAALRGWRVFLYGGGPGVAESAREILSESIHGLRIVGVCDGYRPESAKEIACRIRQSRADVLIVALGQPAQEFWLDAHLEETGAHLGLGVGAFLDFVSGRVTRAPHWMNRLGIEWVFRLASEPNRLWRRYIVGNPIFLWRAWRMRAAQTD